VEYMVETGDLGKAAELAEGLRKYPGDVGALAARLLEEGARSDTEGAAATLEVLQTRLAAGGDRYLPWDRRVCLAIALAQAGRADLSRDQASQCLSALNEARLRARSSICLSSEGPSGWRSPIPACAPLRRTSCPRACAAGSDPFFAGTDRPRPVPAEIRFIGWKFSRLAAYSGLVRP